jgi:hypothetical protein
VAWVSPERVDVARPTPAVTEEERLAGRRAAKVLLFCRRTKSLQR